MKNCLVCQTGQDQTALTRIPVRLEGKPWGDILVCGNCLQTLGADQVKELIRVAVAEKAIEPANILLAGEAEQAEELRQEVSSGTVELPVSPSLLRDKQAFARTVGEKMGLKLWELHRGGVSESLWSASLTPDGEGGFVFSATFAKGQA